MYATYEFVYFVFNDGIVHRLIAHGTSTMIIPRCSVRYGFIIVIIVIIIIMTICDLAAAVR